jgi:hypothetical protein
VLGIGAAMRRMGADRAGKRGWNINSGRREDSCQLGIEAFQANRRLDSVRSASKRCIFATQTGWRADRFIDVFKYTNSKSILKHANATAPPTTGFKSRLS